LNKIREFISHFKIQIFFTLVATACALGVYAAFVTVDQYEIVVDATLGFTVLYLLLLKFLTIQRASNEPTGIKLEFPKDLKYIFFGFFITMIALWASIQVLNLIWYLMDIFSVR
jgi:hypothetical protein